ncbi:DUF5712 family protein [Sphingobacterium bambusae]|uniref:DUF5712 family protein n=1 Tax=Sphingobacterium bambusae TaxID=662858 RepID=A0ABW6BIN7_9SPHI|nr:DUF5712 family protein [Sphingobacterium bambusae]WPL51037.1 DUF5712 family protein [Sphingobacterium bambusae]
MFINITDSQTGDNKGSAAALVQYLEKENKDRHRKDQELWFNGQQRDVLPQLVRVAIDQNIAKLSNNDSKFFLINISPSQKELDHLISKYGKDAAGDVLKEFGVKMMDEYAHNFKRPGVMDNRDLLWFGKLEQHRYYKHSDKEVKSGERKIGEKKEGNQMHLQIIVSRKDITNRIKLSPLNNSRGSNVSHSAKLGQFDRRAFKESGEFVFDRMFDFQRNLKDTMHYASTMRKGTIQDKTTLYSLANLLTNTDHLLAKSEFLRTSSLNNDTSLGIVNTIAEALDVMPGISAGGPSQSDMSEEEKRRRKRRRKL